jgi:zinc protease
MKVHVETSPALPLVTILAGFRGGTVLDPLGKEGLTRIAMRMIRRGTGKRTATQVEFDVDRIGADLGEHAGASSSSVSMDVIRRSLDAGVELLCDVLGDPSFDEAELGKLLREAESEIVEARNNDRGLCVRAFRRTLFEGHPFGRRSSGTIDSLRRITRQDVVDQVGKLVTRDNLVLAFAGDVDADTAARAAERISAALPDRAAAPRVIPDPAPPAGRRLVFVDKPNRTQTQIVIGGLGTSAHDDDHVPLLVASTVLGGTFTSRLMKEVRSKRGWSYGASSSLPVDVCREAFMVWTHPAAADASACVALELDLLEAWRANGVTARELAFAKRYLIRSHAFEVDTPSKRVQRRFATDLFDLPQDYYDRFLRRVEETTLEAANEAIRRRIDTERMVVAITGTFGEIGEAVAAAIPGVKEPAVMAFDQE